ncbi:MAG: tyrosine-type recombinase/integrase [Hyphomicrobiaceae bacterium]
MASNRAQRNRSVGRLRARQIESAKGPESLLDGNGLRLIVRKTGAKTWQLKIRIDGKATTRTIGNYPEVSLAQARELAVAMRANAKAGKDVRASLTGPTFRESFVEMFARRREELSNGKHVEQWKSSMDRYAMPALGDLPVAEVTPRDVSNAIAPIWRSKPETAKRVMQRIELTFKHAIAAEDREKASPVESARTLLGKPDAVIVRHHAALPLADIPDFIERRLRHSSMWTITRLAFEFLVLTVARSGEVRGAVWDEVDIDQAIWTIPSERMKGHREHRVPLVPRAVEILRTAHGMRYGDLVFPGTRGQELSDNTFSKLMRDHSLAGTPHGFRSTFKSWATEEGINDLATELALAHVDKDRVRRAYQRSDMLDQRRDIMSQWAKVVLPK